MPAELMLFSANEVPHGIDCHVAVAHAKLGFPVELRVVRGDNTNVSHLSIEECRQLAPQLAAILALDHA